MPILVVNVDHVATLRQARRGHEPDPVTAAALCELAGAAGIIVHLREDRRHIQDRDLELLRRTVQTHLHLEMAATGEMQAIALKTDPYMVCLVPEKREELTTEGGLNCVGREKALAEYIAPFHQAGMLVSLFIDAEPRQIEAARAIGADYVEIHTGHYADAMDRDIRATEFGKILTGIDLAQKQDLQVNLGHGLNYVNVAPFARVPAIREYSIGHSIMSRAILVGLDRAVKDMVEILRGFAD